MLTPVEIARQKAEQEATDRYYQSLLFYELVGDCEIHLTPDGWCRIMTDPYEGNVMIRLDYAQKVYESLGQLLQKAKENGLI